MVASLHPARTLGRPLTLIYPHGPDSPDLPSAPWWSFGMQSASDISTSRRAHRPLEPRPGPREEQQQPGDIGEEPGGEQKSRSQQDEEPVQHFPGGNLSPGKGGPEAAPDLHALSLGQDGADDTDHDEEPDRLKDSHSIRHYDDDGELCERNHQKENEEERPDSHPSMVRLSPDPLRLQPLADQIASSSLGERVAANQLPEGR